MKENTCLRRSLRLSNKLKNKYIDYNNNTISKINKFRNKIICTRRLSKKIKNMFYIYKLININFKSFELYYTVNFFEKLMKSCYNYTFIIMHSIKKCRHFKFYNKLIKEFYSLRNYYEDCRDKKFYFLKKVLNTDLISLIDTYL